MSAANKRRKIWKAARKGESKRSTSESKGVVPEVKDLKEGQRVLLRVEYEDDPKNSEELEATVYDPEILCENGHQQFTYVHAQNSATCANCHGHHACFAEEVAVIRVLS